MAKSSSGDIHKGHRKRTRESFLANGIPESTPEHKVLEILLFYSIPRCDTNEIAHRLINKFGSLSAVLDAPVHELLKVDGVGEKTVSLLKLIMPIARIYMSDKKENVNKMDYNSICNYIIGKHCGYCDEVVAITCFNNKGSIISFDIIGNGDVSEVSISIRKIVETVLKYNASAAILSHNHPNGNAIPSAQDIETTKRIVTALANINVRLIDHIIVADDDCVSMLQSENLRYVFDV